MFVVRVPSGNTRLRLTAAMWCCRPGDHLQLRPKAEVYRLTKESRKGFDLDVSMFERVRGCCPHALFVGKLGGECLSILLSVASARAKSRLVAVSMKHKSEEESERS